MNGDIKVKNVADADVMFLVELSTEADDLLLYSQFLTGLPSFCSAPPHFPSTSPMTVIIIMVPGE